MRIQSQINQPKNYSRYKHTNFSSEYKDEEYLGEPKKYTQEENKGKISFGSSITIATLATVICLCMLSRGSQKNTNKYLNKFKGYLERKLENTTLNQSSRKKDFYEFSIRRINSFIKKSESINNITSLKDILFMKLMYKTKPTKNIHNAITNYFEKLSRQTVFDSYKKTQENFTQMNNIFDKLDDLILKNSPDKVITYNGEMVTKKELIERAKGYRKTATDVVKTFVSAESQDNRYKYINDVTSSLYSKFWDASFKDFWSKNNKFKRKEMWQTFIAAEQIQGDKTKLAEMVAFARNTITYTKGDRNELINDYIKKLDRIIPANDKEGIDIIQRLDWFTKHPEGMIDNKDLFNNELQRLEKHKIPIVDTNIAKTQEESKASYINIIRDLSEETATGEIQDMMSIYYKLAPFELEKTGASLAVKKAVQSFDKSVNLECVEFFDKIRDLRLGSAPTDVLTIIFSFMALSLGFGYAKDKDAKTSIMLKSGIPIVGGIMAAILTTTKLVSGGKSLAFGFLSGVVLNQLGKIADGIRKNSKNTSQS